MADITAVADENPSPAQDELVPGGNGVVESRGTKRPRLSTAEDDDDDEDKPGRERRKIEIKFIQDKSRRHITFSKRKAGIMKKVGSDSTADAAIAGSPSSSEFSPIQCHYPPLHAYELSVLTGTQVLLLVVSETGLVYTFTTPKLQPLVTKAEGKNLIQSCLNAPEPTSAENGVDAPEVAPESADDVAHAAVGAQQAQMPRGGPMHPGYMTADQQQQMAYYQNLQQQQQQAQAGGQYPGMPVGGRIPQQHQPTA
ncbi:transcription factor of the MADS box [Ophidiomyces ophidiicola]|uniref:Transcription factor of the MADS box n=1 Tax=Ophidiomyces ophidiicola TaxID=1387563 RepID=A0ACB8UQM4_9EURO|nr:transcription factor of the MADS box [Ophidiomyces ophidiicola]KAI1910010.1 transcription factor of the MADS box [Ophidiomyces ophidiicola]KAI1919521.1 transcription factor of the MADS box [Ophidiomyces ophidiicola]KAI1924476.1 transcription factor of the MADS box [Ophidiomyces ophidiicola]KAI1949221.1 transcription factor of the MADS box [Ophidiomyces ophidiicola]KAI1955298.1 transcription factor of the MADS box [Ophidiomyces ophidiicola]